MAKRRENGSWEVWMVMLELAWLCPALTPPAEVTCSSDEQLQCMLWTSLLSSPFPSSWWLFLAIGACLALARDSSEVLGSQYHTRVIYWSITDDSTLSNLTLSHMSWVSTIWKKLSEMVTRLHQGIGQGYGHLGFWLGWRIQVQDHWLTQLWAGGQQEPDESLYLAFWVASAFQQVSGAKESTRQKSHH